MIENDEQSIAAISMAAKRRSVEIHTVCPFGGWGTKNNSNDRIRGAKAGRSFAQYCATSAKNINSTLCHVQQDALQMLYFCPLIVLDQCLRHLISSSFPAKQCPVFARKCANCDENFQPLQLEIKTAQLLRYNFRYYRSQ